MKKIISTLLVGTLLTNLTACGTVLYPERKGQIDGRIDPGVAILDGIGLIFFLVPGVIAYAVDFSNGTIYLPSGKGKKRSSLEENLDIKTMTPVKLGKGNLSEENIQAAIYNHTGEIVDLHRRDIKTKKANG